MNKTAWIYACHNCMCVNDLRLIQLQNKNHTGYSTRTVLRSLHYKTLYMVPHFQTQYTAVFDVLQCYSVWDRLHFKFPQKIDFNMYTSVHYQKYFSIITSLYYTVNKHMVKDFFTILRKILKQIMSLFKEDTFCYLNTFFFLSPIWH